MFPLLPNATLLEITFTVGLFVASGFTFMASLRAWRRIHAVSAPADRRAAIGWFRKCALLCALTLLTFWAAGLSLFAPAPVAPIATQAVVRRWFGIVIVAGLIVDAIWTGFEDRAFAHEFDPQIEERLDAEVPIQAGMEGA